MIFRVLIVVCVLVTLSSAVVCIYLERRTEENAAFMQVLKELQARGYPAGPFPRGTSVHIIDMRKAGTNFDLIQEILDGVKYDVQTVLVDPGLSRIHREALSQAYGVEVHSD